MNTNLPTAPTTMDSWRERERIHWARPRQGDDAQGGGGGDEGEVMPYLVQWWARFEEKRAVVMKLKAAQEEALCLSR